MPDGGSARASSLSSAIAEVGEHLRALDPTVKKLSKAELIAYEAKGAVAGWYVPLSERSDPERRGVLLVDRHFPRSLPLVVLLAPPAPGVWPHVERDGKLCLWPDGTLPGYADPIDSVNQTLGEAWQLIDDCVTGSNAPDLRAEFLSYWTLALPTRARLVQSLIAAAVPERKLYGAVRKLGGGIVIADTEAELTGWTKNTSSRQAKSYRSIPAVLAWLPQPMSPNEYPSKTPDLLALLANHSPGALRLVQEAASKDPDSICITVGSQSASGPCLATLLVHRGRQHFSGGPTRGFRKNSMPPTLAWERWLRGSLLERANVERCDPAWVHGRGKDPNFGRLRNATIAILGCGSLGSRIALDAATAGVGTIILVDPQTLAAANAGRHVLGINAMGLPKAESLAALIRHNQPHIKSVVPFCLGWEEVQSAHPGLLEKCDLIVSAIGNWVAEAALNDWHLAAGRLRPVVYVWTEPHAGAGHAVLVGSSGGCLNCGFDNGGRAHMTLTAWPDDTAVMAEPACGGSFSPYGPAEMTHVTTLASEMVLEALLADDAQSRYQVWAARGIRIEQAGGKWTEEWLKGDPVRARGGFVEDLDWPGGPCSACRGVR